MAELEKLAHDLFFSNLSSEDLKNPAIRDSMKNNCFGIAQDLRLRFLDWGFTLLDVRVNVYMEHSKDDPDIPFLTAAITGSLLPNCKFKIRESGGHFSTEALDEFIKTFITDQVVSKNP